MTPRLEFRRRGPRLNLQLIVPVVSAVTLTVSFGMLVCFVVAVANGDGAAAAFGVTGLAAGVASVVGLLGGSRLANQPLRPRDGFLAVALAWFAAAAVGAIPFIAYPTFTQPVHALFESMSGFTTTGATMIEDVDGQPHAILLWRSMSQWIGGVGIVVLVVAVAPATGLAGQRVFYAETSGITAERLTPRIADTAKILWAIYLALSTACFTAYLIAGMTPWDAVNHMFTTIASGGFSTHTESLAYFDSLAIELVAIAFMISSGVNFAFYWRALRGKGIWPQFAEVRAFLLVMAGGIAVATVSLLVAADPPSGWGALREAAFTVTSVHTSTGYTTGDFDLWNDLARSQLLLLAFIGGCAGSTAGGMKIIRVLLLAKTTQQELGRQLQPKAVQVLRIRGKVFSEDIRRAVLGFAVVYALVAVVGTLIMAAIGLDMITAFSSVSSTLNLTGPGLGEVGASEHYGAVPEGGLVVLTALMLIGRLEIFTILVLLTPAFWRRNIA